MLTSLLVRAGRPFELILGCVDDPDTIDRVERTLRAAAAARRISTARLGRLGLPVEGYECVDLDEDRLRDAIGVSVIRLDPAELVRVYHEVPEATVRGIVEETRSLYATDPALNDGDLIRAARAAAALEELVAAHNLEGGAITCHVQGIRFEPGLGFAPCFALGRMTSRGVPWSCSSDLPAAVAMLTLKALGAAAQYHELEMLDPESGEFLVASSGEHDLAFAGEPPRLVRNGWFPADPHQSVCACFGAPVGPATLLGFAQLDEPSPTHRFVAAAGAFGARTFEQVGTPHAAFRFAGGSAATSWVTWCRAGVGLHTACTPGDLAASVETVGRLLGVEVVTV
jgi:L-arabinose isomerase